MSSVFLTDVDDYIAPSQACINPLFTSNKTVDTNDNRNVNSKRNSNVNVNSNVNDERNSSRSKDTTEGDNTGILPRRRIRRVARRRVVGGAEGVGDSDGVGLASSGIIRSNVKRVALSYDVNDVPSTSSNATALNDNNNNNKGNEKKKATISVADCLACSGCVTSAEAVLVTQHSIQTLRDRCGNHATSPLSSPVVFTISPAVISDLISQIYSPDINTNTNGNGNHDRRIPSFLETYQKLATFLHIHFRANIVLDGEVPLALSLLRSANEFCLRYRHLHPKNSETEMPDDKHETNHFENCRDNNEDKKDIISMNEGDGDVHVNDIDIFTPSIALSATETRFLIPSEHTQPNVHTNNNNNNNYSDLTTKAITLQHNPGSDSRLTFLHNSTTFRSAPNIPSTATLPMLASSCPGFVCYVEKTAPSIVPNLSSVKSPMAIAGAIFKHHTYVAGCYHVAIMPCHDKKLEAGRKDLAWERYDNNNGQSVIPDVDLVITGGELVTLLRQAAQTNIKEEAKAKAKADTDCDINTDGTVMETLRSFLGGMDLAPAKIASPSPPYIPPNDLNSVTVYVSKQTNDSRSNTTNTNNTNNNTDNTPSPNTRNQLYSWGSGGYADYLFRHAASHLFHHTIPPHEPLPWRKVGGKGRGRSRRNGIVSGPVDFCEVSLYRHANGTFSCHSVSEEEEEEEEEVLTFAAAYGFKNVQLILQRFSSKGRATTTDGKRYHYVEVMACPSGCLNGGGLIRDDVLPSRSVEDKDFGGGGGGARRETPLQIRERVKRNQNVMNEWRKQVDTRTKPETESKMDIEMDIEMNVDTGSEMNEDLLHTRFHVVPKLELSTGATAGVALDDTKW